MAFVTPPAFVADTALPASDLNVLSDDISYLKAFADAQAGAGVSLLRGTNLSVVTATYTDMPWVSAPIDITGWWTSGANITVPAGLVPPGYSSVAIEIQASARFDANGTGSRGIEVLLNGSVVEVPFSTSAITGETTPVSVTVWADCVDGDVLKIAVYQSSGANLNCNHANAHVKRLFPIP
jgi:hypothetical protein